MKVALLINFLAPYRISLYEAIQKRVGDLRIYVSATNEPNRNWAVSSTSLNITKLSSIMTSYTWKHPSGFSEKLFIHLPLNIVPALYYLNPDVVVTAELGFRTLQACLYKLLVGKQCGLVFWITVSEITENGRGAIRRWLRQLLLPFADSIIVNGESGAQYLRQFNIHPDKIFKVPYTIDNRLFDSESSQKIPTPNRRLLYVGRLEERKGLIPFIKQLIRWGNQYPERRISLELVGYGPLEAELRKITTPENVSIYFIGAVEYRQLPEVYQKADVLIFPTLADEWGVVVNEAMASGLPIFGSIYSQAVEELITDGDNGWIFHPDQDTEMYEKIVEMLATPNDKLIEMAMQARVDIQEINAEAAATMFVEAVQKARGDH